MRHSAVLLKRCRSKWMPCPPLIEMKRPDVINMGMRGDRQHWPAFGRRYFGERAHADAEVELDIEIPPLDSIEIGTEEPVYMRLAEAGDA